MQEYNNSQCRRYLGLCRITSGLSKASCHLALQASCLQENCCNVSVRPFCIGCPCKQQQKLLENSDRHLRKTVKALGEVRKAGPACEECKQRVAATGTKTCPVRALRFVMAGKFTVSEHGLTIYSSEITSKAVQSQATERMDFQGRMVLAKLMPALCFEPTCHNEVSYDVRKKHP